ncbi:DUF4327 family protein [Chamaesiphon sp. VAR_69_metabat_338]|uniref:DUF4327 family protein n=1 Tax=Chamaesiphon sp. VAR_69_metabat_338 TaxID=2964704 RepID=UPI00286E8214|nr:DUF4327 family protein [Chamaesiphon sp. VAR_69_metabat_338]
MAVLERYCLSDLQDEVRALVARGSVDRQQRIYELKKFFGDRQWQEIEHLVNEYDYVLRGRVIDLIGEESWTND